MLNLNIGLIGHVDSGKTSIAKSLSQKASTAAFDKSTQSKQRGITLDLGFSAFEINGLLTGPSQITLVDCPGHASLIKTVIGGIQIIDGVILVIDMVKGIQEQTVECIALSELIADITSSNSSTIKTPNIFIAINKLDLIPQDKRSGKLKKLDVLLKKAFRFLNKTAWSLQTHRVTISAKDEKIGTDALTDCLRRHLTRDFKSITHRHSNQQQIAQNFFMAYEHCFLLKGKGTVFTGTVLTGRIKTNDKIFIPGIMAARKIKSIQSFHKNVQAAIVGDRIGILTSNVPCEVLERGYICSDKSDIIQLKWLIMDVKLFEFCKDPLESLRRTTIGFGYETVCGLPYFFRISDDYPLKMNGSYEYLPKVKKTMKNCFCLLLFDKSFDFVRTAQRLIIGMRLNENNRSSKGKYRSRLLFYGKIVENSSDLNDNVFEKLSLFKFFSKRGMVERLKDNEVICKDMFSLKTDLKYYKDMAVDLAGKYNGRINGSFGSFTKTGKFKVKMENRDGFDEKFVVEKGDYVELNFKKVVFGSKKGRIYQ